MRLRPLARLAALSPRRRALAALVGAIAVALAAFGGARAASAGNGPARAVPTSSRPSYVLLVPGYGGSTTALSQLAGKIRATGRTATVVPLPGNGTGDLVAQARVLNGYVNVALKDRSGTVTIIAYSARGVLSLPWERPDRGTAKDQWMINLRSPL